MLEIKHLENSLNSQGITNYTFDIKKVGRGQKVALISKSGYVYSEYLTINEMTERIFTWNKKRI